MQDPHVRYLGPTDSPMRKQRAGISFKQLPWPFLGIVVVPSLVSSIYLLGVASPQYVSEARFVVRSGSDSVGISSFGVAFQGVGIGAGASDSFAVHDYIRSQELLREWKGTVRVAEILGRPEADFLSKYPRLGEAKTIESLQAALARHVGVGYDATTGISTLRVKAYRADDAWVLNEALLESGERLVNRLNERAANDAVEDAKYANEQALERLEQIQKDITTFRNSEKFIDPARAAQESIQIVGSLRTSLAELRARRTQLAFEAPDSPELPAINARISAFQREIDAEQSRIAGGVSSLAPSVGVYEELIQKREFITEELARTTSTLLEAEKDARRQKLYLERVVSPSRPEEAVEPKRFTLLLGVIGTLILIYGIGWLLWAGVREHRQE